MLVKVGGVWRFGLPVGARGSVEQGLCRHQHARRAVSALGCPQFREGHLQLVRLPLLGEPFDGLDRAVLDLEGQQEAGKHRLPVHQDRA